MRRNGASGLAALVLLAGCGSIAPRRTPEKIAQIEAGKTTKKELLDLLGLPNEIERRAGVESWIYFRFSDHSTVVVNDRVGARGSAHRRGTDRRDHAATIVFSESDVVIEVHSSFLKESSP